jgi:hypothetical protein
MEFTQITIPQSIRLSKQKLTKGNFIEQYLLLCTKLSQKDITELKVNVAIDYMLQYLYSQFGDIEMADGISLLQLYGDQDQDYFDIDKKEHIKIDGYRFEKHLTVKMLQQAESKCYLKGESDLLGLYVLASMCSKGIDKGLDVISNMVDNIENRNKLYTLEQYINSGSDLKISLLADPSTITIGGVVWSNDFFFFG